MANERAEYEIRLKDAFTPGLKKAEKEMNSFEASFTSLSGKLAAGLSIAAIGGAAKKFSDLAAAAEQTRISFEVLTGSQSAGNKLLGQLKEYANITPYVSKDVLETSKVMLSFGVAQDKILPTMKMLGDVASGDAQKLQSLGLVYGQITATGRLMGQDLLQLINNGFNPLQIISQKTGLSMAVLKKKMEDGAISAKDVANAFKIATNEGGLFFDMTNRQSQTFAGKLSTLADKLEVIFTGVGENLNRQLTPLLDKILTVINKGNISESINQYKSAKGQGSELQTLFESYQGAKGTAFQGEYESQILQKFPELGTDFSTGQAKNLSESKVKSRLDALSKAADFAFFDTQVAFQSIKGKQNAIQKLQDEINAGKTSESSPFEKMFGLDKLSDSQIKNRIDDISKLSNEIQAIQKQYSEFRVKDNSQELLARAISGGKGGIKFDAETAQGKTKTSRAGHGGSGQENERLGGTKNITINVAKLIGIETNENSKNIDPKTIGEAVKKELLTALHDANIAVSH